MTSEDVPALENQEVDLDSSTESDDSPAEISGTLQKWTNYIHGWQDRYFVLKDGCLSYFKDKADVATGSRGSVSLAKAIIREHEFDELRFDIGVNDSVWYCKAKDLETRKVWLDAIELHKNDSSIDSAISRNGSMFSLNSINSGNLLLGKGKFNRAQELSSIQTEIDTLRSLSRQLVDKIEQHMLKTSQNVTIDRSGDSTQNQESELSLFRADCLTFKTTTDNLLDLCKQCVDVSLQQDEKLRKKLDDESKKRKKFEEMYKTLHMEQKMSPVNVRGGPDFEEGPHSVLTTEMWFDALDSAIDKLDENSYNPVDMKKSLVKVPVSCGAQRTQHRFSEACDNYVKENLKYAFSSADEIDNEDGWELMHSEGEMRVYRKEVEIDGLVLDPLKATHQVDGITAEEMCRWFFDPDVKMEWEGHLLDKVLTLALHLENSPVDQH